jgi:hypothetical protein
MTFHIDQSGYYETYASPDEYGMLWWSLRFSKAVNSLRHNSVGTKLGHSEIKTGMYALDATKRGEAPHDI